jgi:hypothetical protein
VPKILQLPPSYPELLQELKGRIRTAQIRAALAVNRELVLLYWSIGRDILAQGKALTNFKRNLPPPTQIWRSRSSATPTTSTF